MPDKRTMFLMDFWVWNNRKNGGSNVDKSDNNDDNETIITTMSLQYHITDTDNDDNVSIST